MVGGLTGPVEFENMIGLVPFLRLEFLERDSGNPFAYSLLRRLALLRANEGPGLGHLLLPVLEKLAEGTVEKKISMLRCLKLLALVDLGKPRRNPSSLYR